MGLHLTLSDRIELKENAHFGLHRDNLGHGNAADFSCPTTICLGNIRTLLFSEDKFGLTTYSIWKKELTGQGNCDLPVVCKAQLR